MNCSFSRWIWLGALLTVGASSAACTREAPPAPDAATDTNPYDARFEYPDSGVLMRDGGGWDGGPSSGLQCESCATNEDCQGMAFCVQLGGTEQRVCLTTLRSRHPGLPAQLRVRGQPGLRIARPALHARGDALLRRRGR
jgi:hypothetical protein